MTRWTDDHTLDAPDGHTWQRPVDDPDDCPNCQCCTRRLCEQAAQRTDPITDEQGVPCTWLVPPADAAIVTGCPCSTPA